MQPLKFTSYKGMGGKFGALQFSMLKPHYQNGKMKDFTGEQAIYDGFKLKEGWTAREGVLFLEMTSATGKNEYDWSNKVTMALSTTDLGKLLWFLYHGTSDNKTSIVHDPGAQTSSAGKVNKVLNVSTKNGLTEGCFFSLSENSEGNNKSHMVPLSGDEVVVLRALLQGAMPVLLAWN